METGLKAVVDSSQPTFSTRRFVPKSGADYSGAAETDSKSDALLGNASTCIVLGVAALATYWAWIFSIFHADMLNPFLSVDFNEYLMLCVVAAGSSAVSMFLFVVFGRQMQFVIDRPYFTVTVAVLSVAMVMPALFEQLGMQLGFISTCVLWALGSFVSSFVYLKTGPFLVWLRRVKLMRCIALAFLFASLLYLLPQFLDPVIAILTIAVFPVASALCSHVVNRGIEPKDSDFAKEGSRVYYEQLRIRVREQAITMPRTLVYTLIFGVVSYTVLGLAVEEDAVFIIGIAIFLSALLFLLYVATRKTAAYSDGYILFLLPLIAVSVLPFPYVPGLYKIFFLAVCIFGFTCFDAISWGDLADEIRERELAVYISFALPTVPNFIGIFFGWSVGLALHVVFGSAGYNTVFAMFSVVMVIALVLLLVWDLSRQEKTELAEPTADSFQDKWRSACGEIAESGGLTKQETKIFFMLARGRNQNYIANELVISPHTVKTHAYRIYQKLGIHSQQELIDLVEGRL